MGNQRSIAAGPLCLSYQQMNNDCDRRCYHESSQKHAVGARPFA